VRDQKSLETTALYLRSKKSQAHRGEAVCRTTKHLQRESNFGCPLTSVTLLTALSPSILTWGITIVHPISVCIRWLPSAGFMSAKWQCAPYVQRASLYYWVVGSAMEFNNFLTIAWSISTVWSSTLLSPQPCSLHIGEGLCDRPVVSLHSFLCVCSQERELTRT